MILICIALFVMPFGAWADDRLVRLAVPQELVQSGLFKHILPRFTLKTRVKVDLVDPGDAAEAVLGTQGRPAFDGLGSAWALDILAPDHPGTQTFAEWLHSDVGLRTVVSFAPDGATPFGPPTQQKAEVVVAEMSGDALLGHEVSLRQCTRCHAVDLATRGKGIGSTPSFGVLRSLDDWEERFSAFYVLKPHGAFTIITDLTPPFPEDRPPPIVPIELSLDDLDAVLAYVAAMPAADLGAPLEHQ